MAEQAQDMEADIRSRVVTLEHNAANNGQRLTNLEAWQRQKDIDSARHDERWKHMDERFNRLETGLGDVNGTLKRVMWIIISGILAGVMAFMMRGGFAL